MSNIEFLPYASFYMTYAAAEVNVKVSVGKPDEADETLKGLNAR